MIEHVVVVTDCDSRNSWHSDRIGDLIHVIDNPEFNDVYILKADKDVKLGGPRRILRNHCEILETITDGSNY